MFGFNWIDLLIICLLVGAIFLGKRIGLFIQFWVIAGFFSVLFLASWVLPHLIPIHDQTWHTVIVTNLVLLLAAYAAIRSFDLGQRLHKSVPQHLVKLESGLGVIVSVIAVSILVWLVGALVGRLPFEAFSNNVNDSRIVQFLDNDLPPIPSVFAEFNRSSKPNSQPSLFVTPKPQSSFDYSTANFQAAAASATASVVRITSFGCGGLAEGSGFAIGRGLIATNAHVIAGVKRPIIKYKNRSYEGVPVLFNPNLDLAILRVNGLLTPTLQLAKQTSPLDTTVAVLGYPGGNFEISPGLIRNNLNVFGRNIYNVGVIERNIYEIQTHVDPGSSGGPVVLANGTVAGIIFEKYNASDDYGYALTSPYLIKSIDQAKKTTWRVSTGVCIAD